MRASLWRDSAKSPAKVGQRAEVKDAVAVLNHYHNDIQLSVNMIDAIEERTGFTNMYTLIIIESSYETQAWSEIEPVIMSHFQ